MLSKNLPKKRKAPPPSPNPKGSPSLPTLERETRLWEEGFSLVAGVDEAGRGPLAGPVVASACIIPSRFWIDGVNDSKKLTRSERQRLFHLLVEKERIAYGIGVISSEEIDRINIYQASLRAMEKAVRALVPAPDYVLVDGMDLSSIGIACRKVVGGDALCFSIAAASILAKETRDRMMEEYDQIWPQYQFQKHKGYGTADHLRLIEKHGPCPIHRRSFAPFASKKKIPAGSSSH